MADILDVVRRVVWPLRSEGRVYRGRCPFHQEHTPSFYVDPDAGVFHCFGCGVGGDAARFVELRDGQNAEITSGKPQEVQTYRPCARPDA